MDLVGSDFGARRHHPLSASPGHQSRALTLGARDSRPHSWAPSMEPSFSARLAALSAQRQAKMSPGNRSPVLCTADLLPEASASEWAVSSVLCGRAGTKSMSETVATEGYAPHALATAV